MSLLLPFVQLIGGLVILLVGGTFTVHAAVRLAMILRLPPAIIGLTMVAFGTSLPELVASIYANLGGYADIAVGNAAGSNIANVGLVLGVTLLVGPILKHHKPAQFASDCIVMLILAGVLIFLLLIGMIPRWVGLILVAGHGGYIFWSYHKHQADVPATGENASLALSVTALIGGGFGLALGAHFLVEGVLATGSALGIPHAILAISVVAIGTSLPELVTCIIAVRHNQFAVALGNILGSNIFNITIILGGAAAIHPMMFDPSLFVLTGAMLLPTSFALALMTFRPGARWVGGVLLLSYIAFLYYQFQS
ncbi:MAG: sodium:calcium antiporter [Pseudomonadota bacterium]